MKKTFKFVGIGFGVLFGVLVVAVVLLFMALPSPSEIGKSLSKSMKASSKEPVAQPKAMPTAESVQSEKSSESPSAQPEVQSDEKGQSVNFSLEKNQEILDNLIDPTQKKYDVCANLKNYQVVPETFVYNNSSLNRNFKDVFDKNSDRKDPVLMALMAPLRFFMQQPQMKSLLQTVVDAVDKQEEDSLVKKASFYAQVYQVYNEMKANKKPAEALVDRGYHLFMMSKVVAKNPSVLSDPQFMSYCQSIEDAANNSVPVDWDKEQSEFQKFLADARVEPSEIGYDPHYKTELQFEQSQKGIQFHGGWIDSIFPEPPAKRN